MYTSKLIILQCNKNNSSYIPGHWSVLYTPMHTNTNEGICARQD